MATLIFDGISELRTFTLTNWHSGGNLIWFLTPDLPPEEGLEFPAGFVVREALEITSPPVYVVRRVPGTVFVDTQEVLLVPPQLQQAEWRLSLNMFAEFRLKVYVS